jgi:hypothetical protein
VLPAKLATCVVPLLPRISQRGELVARRVAVLYRRNNVSDLHLERSPGLVLEREPPSLLLAWRAIVSTGERETQAATWPGHTPARLKFLRAIPPQPSVLAPAVCIHVSEWHQATDLFDSDRCQFAASPDPDAWTLFAVSLNVTDGHAASDTLIDHGLGEAQRSLELVGGHPHLDDARLDLRHETTIRRPVPVMRR